jgi:hypothetical protein
MNTHNKTIVVSFASHGQRHNGMPRREMSGFFDKWFPETKVLYFMDDRSICYHQGIRGISRNIQETAEYIRKQTKDYSKVVFIGVSCGGYAAILFGSLLKIDTVIAFIPQTRLRSNMFDARYKDLGPFINDTTKYMLFGDISIDNPNDYHHISHCDHVAHHPNVHVTRMEGLNMKKLRDDGDLFRVVNDVLDQNGYESI